MSLHNRPPEAEVILAECHAYFDGAMPAEAEQLFRQRLALYPAYQRVFASFQQVEGLLKAHGERPVPPGLAARITQAIAVTPSGRQGLVPAHWQKPLQAAAAVALVLGVSSALFVPLGRLSEGSSQEVPPWHQATRDAQLEADLIAAWQEDPADSPDILMPGDVWPGSEAM